MSYARHVLAVNNDLPIRTNQPIHSGKVRSAYWLNQADSDRLIQDRGYAVAAESELGLMVISDRLSAFDCIWEAEDGLKGVPGKGAALNAISNHWFSLFKQEGLAQSHILEVPHPLVWIVQKARPLKIEAIARQYLTGSMWRAYAAGERNFCGIALPDNLKKDQRLPELLLTPSTKGVLRGLSGIPEADDVNISRQDIANHYKAFNFNTADDIAVYEDRLKQGFALIEKNLANIGQVFVDTKFEFGYVRDEKGVDKLIYMDEVGTPDSSRMWDAKAYQEGKIVENSKEGFRQFLLNHVPDADVLLNKNKMPQRSALAQEMRLPASALLDVSKTYLNMAEKITGKPLTLSDNPREEMIEILAADFGLIY